MNSPNGAPIGCFCHIPKTAGTTVEVMLRRHFGLRHLDVSPRQGTVCDAADVREALRMRPDVASISGHGLRPFVDYGPIADRLVWYTILRDPIPRTISNYQHHVEKKGADVPFVEWMHRPENCNWHVRMLSGGQDLDRARDVLANRIRCFGFLERFNEFMLLLRERMGWHGMKVAYGRPKNPAKKGSVAHDIKKDLPRYQADLDETNALDKQLYDFALRELYPRHVSEYGAERLESDLKTQFGETTPTLAEKLRELKNDAYRRLIYKPLIRARARSIA